MQEEFEKKVQERMRTFGIPPSPQVWDDVNAVLGKKKHRRVFIGWWILLGLVAAGGGVFLYEKDNIMHETLNQRPVITKDTTENNLAKVAPGVRPAQNAKKENTAAQPEATNLQNEKRENTASIAQSEQKSVAEVNRGPNAGDNKQYLKKTPSTAIIVNSSTVSQKNEPFAKEPLRAKTQPKDGQPIAEASTNGTVNKEPPVLQPGSSNQAVPQQQTGHAIQSITPAATASSNLPETPGKTYIPAVKAVKHQWYFTLSGGLTQTRANNSSSGQDKNLSPGGAPSYNNVNILALTSPAALKYDVPNPGTGYNISAGVGYQYKLSGRWRIHAGLQLAYIANTQKAGILYNQQIRLDNGNGGTGFSTGGNNIDIQASYYQGGSTLNTVVNKAWQIQLPVGVNYVVNTRGKTKFIIDAGFIIANMLTSRWLIPDSRYGKLYYNKQVLNNTIVSWQAGPAVEFKSNIKLGVYYQQSFTTLAKKYVTPHLYWQNINIYTAIPFSIKSKK